MNLRKYFVFGFLGAGLSLAGGCGKEESVNRTPASPSVVQVLEGVCAVGLRCCSRGEVDFLIGPYVDRENCVDRLYEQASRGFLVGFDFSTLQGLSDTLVMVPNLGALDQAVQEGRTMVDPAGLEACLQHLTEIACNEPEEEEEEEGCQPPPPPPEESPCDVTKIFVGRLGVGSTCTSTGTQSLECAPGLVCGRGLGLGVTGRCVEAQVEGGVCDSDFECATGMYCSELDGTCHRPRKEGEVCVFADRNDPAPIPETLLVRCENHLSCDPITNTCVAQCQAGARCVTDDDCDDEQELTCIMGRCGRPRSVGLPCQLEEHCEEGLYCGPDQLDPTQLVCTAKKPIATTCVNHDECESGFCPPGTNQCSPAAAVGDECPSGLDAECDGGRCVREAPSSGLTTCLDASECPITGNCDSLTSQCGTYCIALKQDGATCALDAECESEDCIAGFCRTAPLALGVACDDAVDCDSEYCSYEDERVCAELPLPLNARCFSNAECESGVCFSDTTDPPTCITGLGEGEACGSAGDRPCNPHAYYCDFEEQDPPVCVKLKETGESCKSSVECRGDCTIRHGRQMCSAAAPEDEAVCSGADPVGVPSSPDEDAAP